MSYDLAVWEGDRPANDTAAAAEFQRLYDQYVAPADRVEPTARIAAYVRALLDRYPDAGTDAGQGSPWSTAPLMREARGPLVYFPMTWSGPEAVSTWAARLAEERGLNCYDPQRNELRTPSRDSWRFELTSAGGHPVRDPDPETVRRVLMRLSADNYYAVLTRVVDGWYIQVGYGPRAGTRPGWYALERREGTPDQHFRAELADMDEIVQAFVSFTEEDPTIAYRFPWRPYGHP